MKPVNAFFRGLDTCTNVLIFVLLSVMILNTAVSVFFRYVLHNAISWSEETARYLMVWVGFFGMGMAMKDREHVNITFILDALPKRMKMVFLLIADFLVLGFLVIVFRYSLIHLKAVHSQTSVSLMIPMSWPYLSVTVGSGLMILQKLRVISRTIKEPGPEYPKTGL